MVGGGNWGKNHINTLNKLGNLSGIVDSSKEIIQLNKDRYPNCKCFSTIEDSFNYDFDGYIVATPTLTHYKLAKKIIKHGKPVLVEKPFTLSLDDALDLNDYAKSKNINIYVGHLLLFHPAYLKIKEMIDSGLLGKVQYIYSNRLNLGKIRKDENVFWSFAPHDIALLQFFINSFPENSVQQTLCFQARCKKNTDDSVKCQLHLASSHIGGHSNHRCLHQSSWKDLSNV